MTRRPMMTQLPLAPDAIVELLEELIRSGSGAWTFGIPGAVAEFTAAADEALVRRTGPIIEAVAAGGGLRLAVSATTGLFTTAEPPGEAATLVVAEPVAARIGPPAAVTVLGSDGDALRAADRGATLIDLGFGRAAARFCVRTDDPALAARLTAEEGAGWEDALHRVGPHILERSPHRVVLTAAGRAEVYSPIPPPGGTSPDGPHTHLLPRLLASGRDLPAGLELPPGVVQGAIYHPAPAHAPGPKNRSPASPSPGMM